MEKGYLGHEDRYCTNGDITEENGSPSSADISSSFPLRERLTFQSFAQEQLLTAYKCSENVDQDFLEKIFFLVCLFVCFCIICPYDLGYILCTVQSVWPLPLSYIISLLYVKIWIQVWMRSRRPPERDVLIDAVRWIVTWRWIVRKVGGN